MTNYKRFIAVVKETKGDKVVEVEIEEGTTIEDIKSALCLPPYWYVYSPTIKARFPDDCDLYMVCKNKERIQFREMSEGIGDILWEEQKEIMKKSVKEREEGIRKKISVKIGGADEDIVVELILPNTLVRDLKKHIDIPDFCRKWKVSQLSTGAVFDDSVDLYERCENKDKVWLYPSVEVNEEKEPEEKK